MECNLNYKQCKTILTILLILHNLDNYDGKHLLNHLGKIKHNVAEIHTACTLEIYITFKLIKPGCPIQIIFIDAFQFLPTSLEKGCFSEMNYKAKSNLPLMVN